MHGRMQPLWHVVRMRIRLHAWSLRAAATHPAPCLQACKHGCSPGATGQREALLPTAFEKMREAGLGWRAFWSLFPYELREQGNALDDDTVDAIGARRVHSQPAGGRPAPA